MADVVRKSDLTLIKSANTPDYDSGTWLINPAGLITLESGGVLKKYWKLNGTSDDIEEMTVGEKASADAAETAAAAATIAANASSARVNYSLNNVDNTSDLNKPISTATQTALDLKADTSSLVAQASETVAGKAEIATSSEVDAGTDDSRILTTLKAFGVFFKNFNLQVFTGSGTYTPTTGMKYCLVISTGGGGGGGGADTSAGGSGDTGVGGGGGAGGTCIEMFTAAQIGANQTVTIGGAGSAGSGTGGGNGTTGGNTTFGALHTATGGALGTGSGSSSADAQAIAGGDGGVPSGGLLNSTGGDGTSGIGGGVDGTTDLNFGIGGTGGASFWGGGGRGGAGATVTLTTDTTQAGRAGKAFGSGGGGGICLNATAGVSGGAGVEGVCVVMEFI
jgi:hypothetical protein